MRTVKPHPDQLPLDLTRDSELERIIEARVAARCEAESFRWKFRLVAIETVMIGLLVAIAGAVLGQPTMMVARAAVLVAASCFASGLLLLWLSACTGRLATRIKRWRVS